MPESLYTLKGKIETLEELNAQLRNTKEHSTRNKILSVLATVLALALLVGGVFGTLYAANAQRIVMAASIPILTFCLMNFLVMYYDIVWSPEKEGLPIERWEWIYPFIALIIGPCIPIYRTFRYAASCEQKIQTQQSQIQQDLKEIRDFLKANQNAINGLLNTLSAPLRQDSADLRTRGLSYCAALDLKKITTFFAPSRSETCENE